MPVDMLFVPTSKNVKTGNIPQGSVGRDLDEMFESCIKAKCDLLAAKHRGGVRTEYDHTLALNQVDQAVAKGWRAAMMAPFGWKPSWFNRTPDGNRLVLCPAIKHEDVTCNKCGMCDVKRNTGQVIVFPDHGRTAGAASGNPPICYATNGSPVMGFMAMVRSYRNGKDYSLKHALDSRWIGAKYVRLGSVGNMWPAMGKRRIKQIVSTIRSEGLGVLAYDHRAWRVKPGQWMKEIAMASCDGMRRVA